MFRMRLFYNIKFLLILLITLTFTTSCISSCIGTNWTFYEYLNNRNKNDILFYGQVVKYENIDNKFLVTFTVFDWFSESRSLKQIEILMPLTSCEIDSKWLVRPYWNRKLKRYQAGGDCDFLSSQITKKNIDIQNKLSILRLVSLIDKNKLDTTVVLTNYRNEIVAEGTYKNGLAVGIWVYYFNNILKSRYTYNKGIYNEKIEFYSNGYPRLYGNKRTNLSLYYFETDSAVIKTEILTYRRNKTPKTRIGNCYKLKIKAINYNLSGKISDISFQKSYRVKHGANGYVYKRIDYHDNGNIKSIKRFKHEKKVGIWKYYDEFGELERKEIWDILIIN